MKYNYLFLWTDEDYYRYALKDAENSMNSQVVYNLPENNKLLLNFKNFYFSSKVNRIIQLPFKSMFNSALVKPVFDNDNRVCFVFSGACYYLRASNYFVYLRKKYPKCKLVLYLTDTIDRFQRTNKKKYFGPFDIEFCKKTFDLVISYNMRDVRTYKLLYFPSIYSCPSMTKTSEKFDVFFIGRAKNRLKKILDLYDVLISKGLKVLFYICDVKRKEVVKKDGIIWNQYLPYKKVLEFVKESKIILEIVQQDSEGYTFRTNEALAFNKVLISDNPIHAGRTGEKKIYYFNNLQQLKNIPFEEILCRKDNNGYKNELSPLRLIEFIEKNLREQDE